MIYLSAPELLKIGKRVVGEVFIRDAGLLQAALERPRASFDGREVYPNLEEKAAALLHSLARNHALVDGNKRLSLAACLVFLGINGRRLTMSNDEAYDFVIEIATGELESVGEIADRIRLRSAVLS